MGRRYGWRRIDKVDGSLKGRPVFLLRVKCQILLTRAVSFGLEGSEFSEADCGLPLGVSLAPAVELLKLAGLPVPGYCPAGSDHRHALNAARAARTDNPEGVGFEPVTWLSSSWTDSFCLLRHRIARADTAR